MTLLLNILWFIFGGWISGLLWLLAGVLLAITIVGLPWSASAFRMAGFSFAPFGKAVVPRTIDGYLGSGDLEVILNVVWLVFAGWWLALHHVILAVMLFVTIIGIPFAFQHLKLAAVSLAPVGKMVIEV
jgi:uncharacterized membrane protein YccF (DUF307 family)